MSLYDIKKRMSHAFQGDTANITTTQTAGKTKQDTVKVRAAGPSHWHESQRAVQERTNCFIPKYGHTYITNGSEYFNKHSKCGIRPEYQIKLKHTYGEMRGAVIDMRLQQYFIFNNRHTSRCGLDKVTPNVCKQVQWGRFFSKLIHWEQVTSPISKTFRHPIFIVRATCETTSSVMWWPKTSKHSVPYHCIQLTATATTKHYTHC